jgi:hypothetical protein
MRQRCRVAVGQDSGGSLWTALRLAPVNLWATLVGDGLAESQVATYLRWGLALSEQNCVSSSSRKGKDFEGVLHAGNF